MIESPHTIRMPAAACADPAEETIVALELWPDSALFRLAHHLAGELLRRQLPTPAALPIAEITPAPIGAAHVLSFNHP